MAFCTNCGAKNRDDTLFCTECGETIDKNNFNSSTSKYSLTLPTNKIKSSKKIIITIILIILVCVISANALSSSKSGNYKSYESAINDFSDGMSDNDTEKVLKTMMTDQMLDSISAENIKEISCSISFVNSFLKETYEKEPKWSIKVKNKTKLSNSDINELEYYYQNHLYTEIKIKEGYKIKAKLTVCGKTDYIYFNVIRIGDYWKISEDIIGVLSNADF